MKKKQVTTGVICLKDDLGFICRIAKITYTQWEDRTFEYRFWPNYSVIDMLPAELFQGIPGLDLTVRKKCYARKNLEPVFISERSPGENRQDLWQLLEPYQMEYLNRLEWLIRTDMNYSGDRLYVKAYEASDEKQTFAIEDIKKLGVRSAVVMKRLLEIICYGNDLIFGTFTINDATRGLYYPLLMALYSEEKSFILKRQDTGIKKAVDQGQYKGRKLIPIDDTKLHEVFSLYQAGRLPAEEAMKRLGVSRSTFFRRLKRWIGRP